MANLIRIILDGQDNSGAAFASASRNAKTLTADLRSSHAAFTQFGNIASSVGANSLAGLIGSFEMASASAAGLVGKLKDSKLAVAALGAAVGAAGFSVGRTFADWLGFTGASDEKAAAFNNQLAGIMRQIETAKSKLRGDGSIADELARINEEINKVEAGQEAKGAFGGPSFLGGKAGMKAEEVEALVGKLRELRQVTIEVGAATAASDDAEKTREYMALFDQLIQKRYESQNATLGLMNAETQRHEKNLQEIFSEFTIAQGRDNLFEAELLAHEDRKLQIKKEYAEKQAQVAADQARKEQQYRQATLSATAGLFGSLAGLAAAQGRKGFALAQAFRYAETIVNTASGVARALADYPWPYSTIVGGIVAAAGAVQLATIASAKPGGQAHSGLTSVREGGTFELVRGERVVAGPQNADLTEFLEQGRGGGRNVTVNFHMDGMMLGKAIGQLSRDGRLEIDARSVVP